MTDDVLPTLDSLRLTARAWQDILGGHSSPLATRRMLQNSLTELWWALETLTDLMADPGGPHVILGLTGRARKAGDGDEEITVPREPLRWPRPPAGSLEDFLEL